MDLKIRSRIPKNTNKANEWALKVYEQWASFRRDQMDTLLSDVTLPLHLTDGTNCELNYWLSKFIMEIRRQDGTDYPPNSLTNIISGIQRQLRENGRNVNFFKKGDNEFLRLR